MGTNFYQSTGYKAARGHGCIDDSEHTEILLYFYFVEWRIIFGWEFYHMTPIWII